MDLGHVYCEHGQILLDQASVDGTLQHHLGSGPYSAPLILPGCGLVADCT